MNTKARSAALASLIAMSCLSIGCVDYGATEGQPFYDGSQQDSETLQDGSPVVTWKVPLQGATVSGKLTESTCQVTVSCTKSVSKVDFFLDGKLLNTEKYAPYGCAWDTSTASAGTHELTATAYSTSGKSSSASIQVNVDGKAPVVTGTAYYVNATSGNDANDGRSAAKAWRTIAKVNGKKLSGGDVVFLKGALTDAFLGNQKGTADAHITFQGEAGTVIKGISLSDAQYVDFADLEAKGYVNSKHTNCMPLVTVNGSGSVHHVTFTRLHLHDSDRGVLIGNHTGSTIGSDLTFTDTTIQSMSCDGAVFDDFAGDRISFVGGRITGTGQVSLGYGTHGVYASGGHGHVFDGVTFESNANGWSISMRRGDTTVRNCTFNGASSSSRMLENVNEDPANSNRSFWVYDNVFNGPGTGLYQGGHNDPQNGGVADPHNAWFIWNNQFNDVTISFADTTSDARYYDVYMCGNTYHNSTPKMGTVAAGHVHDADSDECPAW